MISKVTSLTPVAGIVGGVMWHASHKVLLPFFTTEMISVAKNTLAEYSDAQVYAWGAAMA
jgi:hypothetical protein